MKHFSCMYYKIDISGPIQHSYLCFTARVINIYVYMFISMKFSKPTIFQYMKIHKRTHIRWTGIGMATKNIFWHIVRGLSAAKSSGWRRGDVYLPIIINIIIETLWQPSSNKKLVCTNVSGKCPKHFLLYWWLLGISLTSRTCQWRHELCGGGLGDV